MAKKDNTFQYEIGEKWASEFFSGKTNQGYIVRARAHCKKEEEDITYNKASVGSLFKQLQKLNKTSDNYLIIVRTYEKQDEYSLKYSYFIHVSEKLIEKHADKKSLTFYPRRNGDFGIDYWEKTGLVKYYPIDKSYLTKTINYKIAEVKNNNKLLDIAKESKKRDPVWHRDELILALELFFRHNPSKINENHPEVTKLSELLNKLLIHTDRPDKDTFRNNNEVYMKLSNFLRLDSSYSSKGLTGGGKLETDIWNEFADDLNKLKLASELIKSNIEINETTRKVKYLVSQKVLDNLKKQTIIFGERELENAISRMSDEEFKDYINTFDENSSLEVKDGLLKIRKYNKKIIDDLKKRASYCCQICGVSSIGDYGVSVVEGHHIESFSLTQNNKPENIMILCPNHHRLIHKAKGIFNKSNLTIKYANGKVDIITIPLHLN